LNGQKPIGSYYTPAAGLPPTITTKRFGPCTISRPGDDVQGNVAFRNSQLASDGCLDFARLSNSPIAYPNDPVYQDPNLSYRAFARDAMSYVVTNTSIAPRQASRLDMQGIYTCQFPGYHPYLPSMGTQLRANWLNYLQLEEADVDNGVYPCIQDRIGGQAIPE